MSNSGSVLKFLAGYVIRILQLCVHSLGHCEIDEHILVKKYFICVGLLREQFGVPSNTNIY